MKFKQYLNEGMIQSAYKSLINDLKKLSWRNAKEKMKKSFDDMMEFMDSEEFNSKPEVQKKTLELINKKFKTNYSSLSQIRKLHEGAMNEDLSHFWDLFKIESWPALSVFPTLSLWFEIDKLWNGVGISDLNYKKMIVYGILWLFLLTGKHIQGYNQWKKTHKDEFEKEGKPGVFKKGNV